MVSMILAFASMLMAIRKYHNRTREHLRPMSSFNSLLMLLMWTVILVTRISVYILSFLNTPGFFFVPMLVKILASVCLLYKYVPTFRKMEHHQRLVYLLISFLVPISIPSKDTKKMQGAYTISLILFFLECFPILCFPFALKRFYHFSEFCQVYSDFPQVIHTESIFSFLNSFKNLWFALLVAVPFISIVSGVGILLSTKVFHPKNSLFKNSSAFNKTPGMKMVEV